MNCRLDSDDYRIITATQGGLPLAVEPFHVLARQLEMDAEEVMGRLRRMQVHGVVRRIGAVPNHYALGYRANGMSVWDVADECVDQLGEAVGGLPFVTHCYQRPRQPPDWPYNLFAMVHGRDRAETETKVRQIAAVLGAANRGHSVLYSKRILKKTGLRLAPAGISAE